MCLSFKTFEHFTELYSKWVSFDSVLGNFVLMRPKQSQFDAKMINVISNIQQVSQKSKNMQPFTQLTQLITIEVLKPFRKCHELTNFFSILTINYYRHISSLYLLT